MKGPMEMFFSALVTLKGGRIVGLLKGCARRELYGKPSSWVPVKEVGLSMTDRKNSLLDMGKQEK